MKKFKPKKCQACKQRKLYYRNGLPVLKYCLSCRKIKELEKKEKHKLTKGFREREYKKLHNKAWGLMSEWIRRSAANESGNILCFTCCKIIHWKEAHCSHFHHKKLDFDNRNLKACCSACNTYKHGNLAIYATKLVMELTPEGMEKLYLDSNTIRYTKDDLENIIYDLELKLKLLP